MECFSQLNHRFRWFVSIDLVIIFGTVILISLFFLYSVFSPSTNHFLPNVYAENNEKIIFVHTENDAEIYMIDIDGNLQTNLTNNPAQDTSPSFSSVNNKIVFVREIDDDKGEIYIMDIDGTNKTRLTNNEYRDGSPTWSLDGTKIAFASMRGPGNNWEIYTMNIDGTDETQLTEDGYWDHSPSWSPDGRIVFASQRDEGNAEIYIMNADGGEQTRLTVNAITNASWSNVDLNPDLNNDGKVVFQSNRGEWDAWAIFTMNVDGSDELKLTEGAGNQYPKWSQNGSRIVFQKFVDSKDEIYIMNADGSEQTRLTTNGNNSYPNWILEFSDTQPPIITVPDEILRKTTNENGIVVDFDSTVSATDNVGILNNPICTPQSGILFPIGETTVACTVDDINGNRSEKSFIIKIEFDTISIDSNSPIVIVPGSITKEATSENGSIVEFRGKVTATDDIGVVQGPSCTPESGSVFPIGETIVTCKAFDAYGNSGTTSFQVIVLDKISTLTIIAPSDITIEAIKKNMSIDDIDFGIPVVLGTDDSNLEITNNAPSSFALGVTPITWVVLDSFGKTATVVQNITVHDTTDPEIIILTPVQGEILSDSDTIIITGTSSDNLGNTDKVELSINGGEFGLASETTSWSFIHDVSELDDANGNISIKVRATDESGNIAEHQITVKFEPTIPPDKVAPIVTIPGDIIKEATSKNGVLVEFEDMVVATDNISVTQGPTCDYSSGSVFPIGETIVTCKAFDARGNIGVNSFEITVIEPEPQLINPALGIQYYVEIYNTDSSFKSWFDIEYPDITLAQYFQIIDNNGDPKNLISTPLLFSIQNKLVVGNEIIFIPIIIHDPSNQIKSFEWDFGDESVKETTQEKSIIHTYNTEGEYPVILRTIDSDGNYISEILSVKSIEINPINEPSLESWYVVILVGIIIIVSVFLAIKYIRKYVQEGTFKDYSK